MKKTVLYIAAVLAVSGGLMWQRPMVAHAEPEVIQEAPVSTVLEVAAEEVADEDNGPAPEIQAAKKLEEELAAAEEEAARAAEEAASARQNLVDYALQFVGGPYRAGGNDPHTGVDCSGNDLRPRRLFGKTLDAAVCVVQNDAIFQRIFRFVGNNGDIGIFFIVKIQRFF